MSRMMRSGKTHEPDDIQWLHESRDGAGLVKIVFELDEGGPFSTESMWARPIDGDVFVLDNIPFYVFGVSFGDHVRATKYSDGVFKFRKWRNRAAIPRTECSSEKRHRPRLRSDFGRRWNR
jgi:hypothetical protein